VNEEENETKIKAWPQLISEINSGLRISFSIKPEMNDTCKEMQYCN